MSANRGRALRYCFDEVFELLPADHAGFKLIPAGSGPVGLDVDIAVIAVRDKRRHLAFPIDITFAEGSPKCFMPVEVAILGMNVANALRVEHLAARKGEQAVDREALLKALTEFLEANNLKVDWEGIENAPNEALVNALAMMSPYGPPEKQAMLEAPDLKTRAEILIAVTEMDLAKKRTSNDTGLQ